MLYYTESIRRIIYSSGSFISTLVVSYQEWGGFVCLEACSPDRSLHTGFMPHCVQQKQKNNLDGLSNTDSRKRR